MFRDQLLKVINTNNYSETNRSIAKYILEHMEDMPSSNIQSLAKACSVSNATITRFCHSLNFESYKDLKESCMDEIALGHIYKSTHQDAHSLKCTKEEFLNKIPNQLNDLFQQIQQSILEVEPEKMIRLAKEIVKHDNVFFVGVYSTIPIMSHIQYELLTLGKLVYMFSSEETFMEYPLPQDALVVVVTPYGYAMREGSELRKYMDRQSSTYFTITQSRRIRSNNSVYFKKCDVSTADYMCWMYIAEYLIYEVKAVL